LSNYSFDGSFLSKMRWKKLCLLLFLRTRGFSGIIQTHVHEFRMLIKTTKNIIPELRPTKKAP
ncbi:MAG: hypothetical protein ACFFB3_16460, partial [Candidatus Hodarchaeota archaeon]